MTDEKRMRMKAIAKRLQESYLQMRAEAAARPAPEGWEEEMGLVLERRWTYRGIECVAVAHPRGHRCGYVEVPEEFPLMEDDAYLSGLECHGSVSYSDFGVAFADRACERFWVGFDCGHLWDLTDPMITAPHYARIAAIMDEAMGPLSRYDKVPQGVIRSQAYVEG